MPASFTPPTRLLDRINSKHVQFLNLRPNPSTAVVSSSPTQGLHNSALDYQTSGLYRTLNPNPNPLVRWADSPMQ